LTAGAAAVSIRGETTHSALCLNKQSISDDEIERYEKAYLLIVDEASFDGKDVFYKINDNLERRANSMTHF